MNTNIHSQHESGDIMADLARVYRSVEVAESGAALDANVLAAARRHIAQKQAVTLVQKKPARRHWLWLPGSVLACGVIALVAVTTLRDEAGQAGFVQPASIGADTNIPSRPAYEHPISDPLQAPAIERRGDVCAIRNAAAGADMAVELKRLEEAGCAASVARLRQSSNADQKR